MSDTARPLQTKPLAAAVHAGASTVDRRTDHGPRRTENAYPLSESLLKNRTARSPPFPAPTRPRRRHASAPHTALCAPPHRYDNIPLPAPTSRYETSASPPPPGTWPSLSLPLGDVDRVGRRLGNRVAEAWRRCWQWIRESQPSPRIHCSAEVWCMIQGGSRREMIEIVVCAQTCSGNPAVAHTAIA